MTDMDASIKRMRQFLAALALAAALVMLVGLATVLGPAIESRYWPVLTDVRYAVIGRTEERMTLDWWGSRNRQTCTLIGVTALVKRPESWVLAVLSPAGDADDGPLPHITRPVGYQQLRRVDVIPAGSAIVMQLRHQCHALWPTVTHLPEVALP